MPSTCKQTAKKGSNISMHRIPPKSESVYRQRWLKALNLTEGDVRDHHRICSRHFQNGDATQIPSLHLGERFVSPKKSSSQRCKTVRKRKNLLLQYDHEPIIKHPNTTSTSTYIRDTNTSDFTTSDVIISSTPVGEALVTDYCVLELPSETISSSDHNIGMDIACSSTTVNAPTGESQGLVHAVLTARIEFLEAQNKSLTQQLATPKVLFRIADIKHK